MYQFTNNGFLQPIANSQQLTTNTKNVTRSAKLFFSENKIGNETATNPYGNWVL